MVTSNLIDKRFNRLKDARFSKLPKTKQNHNPDKRFQNYEKFLSLRDPTTGKKCLKFTDTNECIRTSYPLKKNVSTSKKVKSLLQEKLRAKLPVENEHNSQLLTRADSTCSSSNEKSSASDTSSDNEFSGSDTENPELKLASAWKTVHEEAPTGDASHRLALVGCNWDNVTSDNLFSLFASVLSQHNQQHGCVYRLKRVAIYASNFGWNKLQSGETFEEFEDINAFIATKNGDNDDTAASTFAIEAFRRYQMERSRYYYAVIECENVETAQCLYDELDGVDCDLALDSLDFRFIPNDMAEFTQTFPRQCVSEALKPSKKATVISTDSSKLHQALRHSKAACDWDENPSSRVRMFKKTFTENELEDLDLKDYLASDSETSNSENYEDFCVTIDDIQLPHRNSRCITNKNSSNDKSNEKDETVEDYQLKILKTNVIASSSQNEYAPRSTQKKKELFSSNHKTTFSSHELDTFSVKDNNRGNGSTAKNLTPWEMFLQKRKKKRLEDKRNSKQRQEAIEPIKCSKKKTKKRVSSLIIKSDAPSLTTTAETSNQHENSLVNTSTYLFNQIANDERFDSLFTDKSMAMDITNSKFKGTDALKSFISKIIEMKKRRKK